MKKISLFTVCFIPFWLVLNSSQADETTKNLSQKEQKESSQLTAQKKPFYLSPESPLNKESLDLSQALFIGETSLSFNIRNPLDGTSGGNACSSCSH